MASSSHSSDSTSDTLDSTFHTLQKTNPCSPFTTVLNSAISVKLDRTNYSIWRSQVLPALRGHDLAGYVFGTKPCPPEFLDAPDGNGGVSRTINPAYTHWIREDQLLLSWLLSSISPSLLSQVVRCKTTSEVWHLLEMFFVSRSRSRMLQLKVQLQTTKKGSLSIADYFAKMQSFVDDLALGGYYVNNDELVMCILTGLPSDYDATVIAILSRNISDEMSIQEVQPILLTQELRLEQMISASTLDLAHSSANFASSRGRGGRGRGGPYRGQGRGGRHGGNGSAGRGTNGSRPVCQICEKQGHVALACWHRMDESYQSHASPHQNSNKADAAAFVATPETVADPSWYADTGATNHVTAELDNMTIGKEYTGHEKLMVGNGQHHWEGSTSGAC